MMLIDTHSHLYSEQFDEDRAMEIANCREAGLQKVLLPNVDSNSVAGLHQLTLDYPDFCFPMMGLHPCSVKEDTVAKELELVKKLLFDSSEFKYVAVGEIGIDLYWDKSTLQVQQDAFAQQIMWAKELELPIVIHARDSYEEIFEIVDQHNDESLRGIFHCFTGGKKEANKILSYGGFLMGIGGVVTFKNSGLTETLRNIPLESLVLETDAPYLAPTPHRGKRNQSSYLPLIADKLANIYGVSGAMIAQVTSHNANKMFKL